MKRILLLSMTAAIAFASCKKNNSSYSTTPGNNSGTNGQMSYQLTAVNRTSALEKTSASGNIVWSSGFANPQMIKFEAKQNNTEIEYKSTNTTQIDLFAPVAITFGGFNIPDGTYDEIELQIHLDKQGSAPALQLQGQFDNGTVSIPILLQVDDEIELKTEQKNVVVDNTSTIVAITTLDLSGTLIDIKESMILSGTLTNGVLIISRNSNKAIYETVVNNLRSRKHHCEFEHHHK